MKNYLTYFVYLVMLISCQVKINQDPSNANEDPQNQFDEIYEGLEFEMPRVLEPSIPDNSVNITDFGAVSGGIENNTEAFKSAIDALTKDGGGKVIVPRGIWLTGPITLKSNINLHLEEGSLILFSRDFDEYPLVETSFEGLNTVRCQSPINGRDLENVAITGKGIIDGSGDAWRMVKRSKLTTQQWKDLVASGGVLSDDGDTWYPTEKSKKGSVTTGNFNVPKGYSTMEEFEEIKDYLRPVMVSLINCNKVLLDGLIFQNSPAWNIHPLMCENVILRNLTVRNPWYSQNGDGLDLESCKNSIIYNCQFDVGDDAICIKSGKDEDGRERGIPTENLIIKNNIVYHGHGGVVVGSEMSGGVKNVHVSECMFIGTDVGLRFKSTRGRGGIVENIYISNIDMIDIPTDAIRFNMYYSGNSPVVEPEQEEVDVEALMAQMPDVTEETPQFRNIFMKDIVCRGAGRAVYLQGLPEMNLENVTIENATLIADKGLECFDAKDIVLKNVYFESDSEPLMLFLNGKNVQIEGLTVNENKSTDVTISGPFTDNIQFTDSEINKENVTIANSVKEEVIFN